MKISLEKVLFFILAVSFTLRFVGVNYGLPYFFAGDEASQLGGALVMLDTMNLIPATSPEDFKLLYYPPLMSYMYLLVLLPVLAVWLLFSGMDTAGLAQSVILDPTVPWLAGRMLMVIMGTATVYLVYKLAKRLFNQKIALLSAFILGVSFFHVSLSHFTRHWVPTIFFEVLVMLAAVDIWKRGNIKDYIKAGFFTALSFGAGFIGILCFFFPLAAHLAKYKNNFLKAFKDKRFWLGFASFAFFTGIIVLLYPQRFLEIAAGTDVSVSEAKSIHGFFGSFIFYFKTVWWADPVLLVLGFIGAIWLFIKRRNLALIAILYIFLYISALYFIIHNEPRYISFIYPIVAVFAALPAGFLLASKYQKKYYPAIVILIVLLLAYPLLVSAKFSVLLTKKDTRLAAKSWLEQNIPENTRILSTIHPWVIIPNKEAILSTEKLNSGSLRSIDKVLLALQNEEYPKAYNVLNLKRIEKNDEEIEELIAIHQPDYIVWQSWQGADPPPLLLQNYTIIHRIAGAGEDYINNFSSSTFKLLKKGRLGPEIIVLQRRVN